jgi:hypothetical protein
MALSVILTVRHGGVPLDLTLASLRGQRDQEFEVVKVTGENRAAARNVGLEQARHAHVVFVGEDQLVAPNFTAEVARALERHSVVLAREQGIVSHRFDGDAGFRARPIHPGAAWTSEPVEGNALFSTTSVEQRFSETVAAFAIENAIMERVEPLIARFGAALEGLRLPWLAAFGGCLAAARDELRAMGGFDTSLLGWDVEDFDLPYRLAQRGATFTATDQPIVWRQLHPFADWPLIGIENLARFSERHGTLEAFTVWRFLRGEDPAALNAEAGERAAGGAGVHELERVVNQLLPRQLEAARRWWRP